MASPAPLSAEQQTIAAHRGSHARVFAGPGTGKSRTLTERVRGLLASGLDAKRILALTFTRTSAQDLRDTLESAGLDPTGSIASTLHAYAFRQVRRNTGDSLLGEFLLDDWEEKKILRQHLARRTQLTPGRVTGRLREYDAAWDTLTTPPSFPAQAVFESELRRLREVLRFARRGELVNAFKEVLDADPDLDPGLSFLIVDEFQDFNRCDQAVIERLAGSGAELLVAGDDDQSIYAFRHADASGIRDFPTTFPGSVTYTLSDCYRCCPEVVERSQALIAYEAGRIPKTLISMRPPGGVIEARAFPSPSAQHAAIVKLICEELDAGTAPNSIIVLAPRKNLLDEIRDGLAKAGRSVIDLANTPDMLEESGVRKLRYAARLALDSEDAIALNGWLACQRGIGIERIGRLVDVAHDSHLTLMVVARTSGEPRILATLTALDDLIAVLTGPGDVEERFRAAGTTAGLGDAEMEPLVELAIDVSAESEPPVEDALAALAQYDWQRDTTELPAVRLLTLHSAKGLTADVVVIPDANDEIIPGNNDESEQRRLFYVSITRARRRCVVTYTQVRADRSRYAGRGSQMSGIARTRTRYLKEAGVETVARS